MSVDLDYSSEVLMTSALLDFSLLHGCKENDLSSWPPTANVILQRGSVMALISFV